MIPHKKHCKRHAVNKAERKGELNGRKEKIRKGFAKKNS